LALAVFALLGVLMVVRPAGVVFWLKSVHPYLRDDPALADIEDNPIVQSFVKFVGIVIVGVAVLIFVAFALKH
jgi:hypothetical protein